MDTAQAILLRHRAGGQPARRHGPERISEASPVTAHLLEIRGLKTHFPTREGLVRAVDGIDFHVDPGGALGIVGESGSGKSMTVLSVMRLLPPPGRIVEGEVL